MTIRQLRQAQLAAELGPEATSRLQAYMRTYNEQAATLGLTWCPRCRCVTETRTAWLSTYVQERTCQPCGYLKR